MHCIWSIKIKVGALCVRVDTTGKNGNKNDRCDQVLVVRLLENAPHDFFPWTMQTSAPKILLCYANAAKVKTDDWSGDKQFFLLMLFWDFEMHNNT